MVSTNTSILDTTAVNRAELARTDRLLLLIGSLGPLGYLPASGTFTVALLGIPTFWATQTIPIWIVVFALLIFIALSVVIHQRGDRLLGTKDSGRLVWDELAGFFVAVIGLPFTWKLALLALLLERAFDISKLWPARWIEDHWPGGLGVVGDDLIAGLYTLLTLHLVLAFVPQVVH